MLRARGGGGGGADYGVFSPSPTILNVNWPFATRYSLHYIS